MRTIHEHIREVLYDDYGERHHFSIVIILSILKFASLLFMIVFFPLASFFLLAAFTRLAFWIAIIGVPMLLLGIFWDLIIKFLGLKNSRYEREPNVSLNDVEQLSSKANIDTLASQNHPNKNVIIKSKKSWKDPFNPDDSE